MNARGGSSVLIVCIFIVLAIAVILVVILINGKEEPPKLNQTFNSSLNISYHDIILSSNAVSPINYFVSNQTTILSFGQMFPSTIENFRNVSDNTTLFLSGFSDKYYLNTTSCIIVSDSQSCRVGLKLKALDYSIAINSYKVVVDAKDGVVQKPMFCFSYRSNVANIYMNLTEVLVPTDLKASYDVCYNVSKDIVGVVEFPIDIHANLLDRRNDIVTVLCRDYETDGYKNMGDKSSGVMI